MVKLEGLAGVEVQQVQRMLVLRDVVFGTLNFGMGLLAEGTMYQKHRLRLRELPKKALLELLCEIHGSLKCVMEV